MTNKRLSRIFTVYKIIIVFVWLASIFQKELHATNDTIGGGSARQLLITYASNGTFQVYKKDASSTWQRQLYSSAAPIFTIKIGDTVFCSYIDKVTNSGTNKFTITDIDAVTTGNKPFVSKRFSATYRGYPFSIDMKISYDTSNADFLIQQTDLNLSAIPQSTPITLAYGYDIFVNGCDRGYAIIVPDPNRYSMGLAQGISIPTQDVRNLRLCGGINCVGAGSLIGFFPIGRPFDRAYSASYSPANSYNFAGSSTSNYFTFGPCYDTCISTMTDNGIAIAYNSGLAGVNTQIRNGITFSKELNGELDYNWNGSKNVVIPLDSIQDGDISLNLKFLSYSVDTLRNIGYKVDLNGLKILSNCQTDRYISGNPTCVVGNTFFSWKNGVLPSSDSASHIIPVSVKQCGQWSIDANAVSEISETLPLGLPALLTVTSKVNIEPIDTIKSCAGDTIRIRIYFPANVTPAQDAIINLSYAGDLSEFSPMPPTVTIKANRNDTTLTLVSKTNTSYPARLSVKLSPTQVPFVLRGTDTLAPISIKSPILSSIDSLQICNNTPFLYTATSPLPATQFSWSRAVTPGISNPAKNGTGNLIKDTLVNTTTNTIKVSYQITLVGTDCQKTQYLSVYVLPAPTIKGSLKICAKPQQDTASYSTESGKSNYNWTITGGNVMEGLGTSQIKVRWITTGNQVVKVNYKQGNGCIDSTSVGVNISTDPIYQIVNTLSSNWLNDSSFSLRFCVNNIGIGSSSSPFDVSLYVNSRSSANRIATTSFATAPSSGDTSCYLFNLPLLASMRNANLILAVNDKGTGSFATPSCDTSQASLSFTLLLAAKDYSQVFSNTPSTIALLSNDFLGTCNLNQISLQILQTPIHAIVSLTADKKVLYTSDEGYEGLDSLQYEINCNGVKDTAWLILVVIDMPDNISEANCFVPNGGKAWGIRQAGSLGVTSAYFTPLVGDLDGDGKPEIVIPSKHGTVINNLAGMTNNHKLQYISIFRGTDRSRIEFSTKMPFYPIGPGMLAIARINLNGRDTGMIIVAEADLFLRAYNMNGVLLWKSDSNWSTNTSTYAVRTATSVGIADFNGDGIPEVYAGNRIFNALTGKFLCKGSSNFGYLGYNELNVGFYESTMTAVADIMGDNKLELAAGSEVYEVDPTLSTMKIVASLDTIICIENPSLKVPKDGFTQLIDIDNDGKLEVLVECRIETSKHFIYIWSPHRKRVLAQKLLLNTDKIGVPFIGDIDGNADKKPEILMIGSNISYTPLNNSLYAFKYKEDSTLLSSFWTIAHGDNSGVTGLTLFDFNQDGISEIVYRDETLLRIINGSKKSHKTYNDTSVVYNLASFNCTSGTGYEYPTIADIDGDGAAEILIAGSTNPTPVNGDLQIFKSQTGTSWAPARKVWNQYAYKVVNVNNDLTIPRYEMKSTTIFPGNDGIIGTSDDIKPYNAFLQQQTNLNKYGTTLFTTPNYVLLKKWTAKSFKGDSVSVRFCVLNNGDEKGSAPLYVSAYKGIRSSVNLLALDSFPLIPNIGDTICYTLMIKNFSRIGTNQLVISVNDKGTGSFIVPECDTTDGYFSMAMLLARANYGNCFPNCKTSIPILSNDMIADCTPESLLIDTIPKSGPYKGVLEIEANKTFSYQATTNSKGIDSVSYFIKCDTDSSANTVYILINDPIQADACPSITTTVGFNALPDISYYWYTQQFAGSPIANGNPSNRLTITKNGSLDITTLWVEPRYKGYSFPRIRILINW